MNSEAEVAIGRLLTAEAEVVAAAKLKLNAKAEVGHNTITKCFCCTVMQTVDTVKQIVSEEMLKVETKMGIRGEKWETR